MPRGKANFSTMEYTGKGVENREVGLSSKPHIEDVLTKSFDEDISDRRPGATMRDRISDLTQGPSDLPKAPSTTNIGTTAISSPNEEIKCLGGKMKTKGLNWDIVEKGLGDKVVNSLGGGSTRSGHIARKVINRVPLTAEMIGAGLVSGEVANRLQDRRTIERENKRGKVEKAFGFGRITNFFRKKPTYEAVQQDLFGGIKSKPVKNPTNSEPSVSIKPGKKRQPTVDELRERVKNIENAESSASKVVNKPEKTPISGRDVFYGGTALGTGGIIASGSGTSPIKE